MKTEIKHIARIQTGVFAKPDTHGEVVYLQSKHFDENGQLMAALHPDLPIEDIAEKHILLPGDVLFAAKGTKNFAVVYEAGNPVSVASTSFFVLRLANKNISPHYLAWFLNSHTTQTRLKNQAIGTAIVSISKSVLEELDMPIPDIQTQAAVLVITALRKKEKLLKQQIEALREKQIQQQIINAITY